MLKLFQSIFGGGEDPGRYPESLVEAAIERAVDGTDPRIRTLLRYRRLLREPVVHAIDHVIALVDSLPSPQSADRAGYRDDLRLATLFASADRMLDIFAHDPALDAFRTGTSPVGGRVTALLLAERVEKHVMGMELDGDLLRREVAQTAVDFRDHRLVDPMPSEEDTRRQLKRRAFDHLLSLALTRIAEVRSERDGLSRQRALLRRKLDALQRVGWGFDAQDAAAPDPAVLQAELDETERQLAALGANERTLDAHLEIAAAVLADAERQLWREGVELHLDRMNIRRETQEASARHVSLQELHNARGHRLVELLVSIALDDMPPRDDFFTAAQRILG